MSNGFGNRIRKLDITDAVTARQIFALQKKAYQVEAELIGSEEIPPLMESLDELMASDETFFGYDESGEVVAALSYKRDGKIVDIYRMMVHPNHFRKGIAKQLLRHLETVESGVQEIIVSTGSANIPAVNLYKKLGFQKVGEIMVGERLLLSQFLKRLAS